jgi:hypothetical protein
VLAREREAAALAIPPVVTRDSRIDNDSHTRLVAFSQDASAIVARGLEPAERVALLRQLGAPLRRRATRRCPRPRARRAFSRARSPSSTTSMPRASWPTSDPGGLAGTREVSMRSPGGESIVSADSLYDLREADALARTRRRRCSRATRRPPRRRPRSCARSPGRT